MECTRNTVRPAENTKRNIRAGCLDHLLDDIRVIVDGTFANVVVVMDCWDGMAFVSRLTRVRDHHTNPNKYAYLEFNAESIIGFKRIKIEWCHFKAGFAIKGVFCACLTCYWPCMTKPNGT